MIKQLININYYSNNFEKSNNRNKIRLKKLLNKNLKNIKITQMRGKIIKTQKEAPT